MQLLSNINLPLDKFFDTIVKSVKEHWKLEQRHMYTHDEIDDDNSIKRLSIIFSSKPLPFVRIEKSLKNGG